jgi:hypothetical protein
METPRRYAVHLIHTPDGGGCDVLRKIDFFLMPVLIIAFMLQHFDKVILNGASPFGIIEDLDLSNAQGYTPGPNPPPILDLQRYSTATLIFYWGCVTGCVYYNFFSMNGIFNCC